MYYNVYAGVPLGVGKSQVKSYSRSYLARNVSLGLRLAANIKSRD